MALLTVNNCIPGCASAHPEGRWGGIDGDSKQLLQEERQQWEVWARELFLGQQPTSAELDLWAAEQKK